MLINVKMPTIVGILTFMSRTELSMKSFITSGPDQFPIVALSSAINSTNLVHWSEPYLGF